MSHVGFRVALCCLLTAFSASARSKSEPAPKDSFDVVAHLALDGVSVTSIVTTSHFSLNYLYATSSSAHTVTLLDVTDSAHPKVLSRVNSSDSLLTAVGDVALMSSDTPSPAPAKKISIVDFSDKTKPRVVREFVGVTSMTSDERRGLVFLTNAEGLWILHRNQPVDPEVQERYAHEVLYNH